VEEPVGDAVLFDRRRGDRRRDRDPAAQGLRDGEDVDDALELEPEHGPQASEARLGLVRHEQHAPLLAQLTRAAEVSLGRVDDSAGR
jgi:hypothetical protein